MPPLPDDDTSPPVLEDLDVSYLGIGTTAAIFCGGVVRWLAERDVQHKEGEEETSPGSLFASGLIAAGGIVGLMAIAVKYMETEGWLPPDTLKVESPLADSSIGGLLAFMALGYSLYYFARKPLGEPSPPPEKK